MRYNITFENFISWLETQIEKAENHKQVYTPSNLEQIYKANNFNVLYEIYDLAKRTGLTFYDASYLQTAIDLKLSLATYDKQLRKAAENCKIKLLP